MSVEAFAEITTLPEEVDVNKEQYKLSEKIIFLIEDNKIDFFRKPGDLDVKKEKRKNERFKRKGIEKLNMIFKKEKIISEELRDCSLRDFNEEDFPKLILEFKEVFNPLKNEKRFKINFNEQILDMGSYQKPREKIAMDSIDCANNGEYVCLTNDRDELVLIFMAKSNSVCYNRYDLE